MVTAACISAPACSPLSQPHASAPGHPGWGARTGSRKAALCPLHSAGGASSGHSSRPTAWKECPGPQEAEHREGRLMIYKTPVSTQHT